MRMPLTTRFIIIFLLLSLLSPLLAGKKDAPAITVDGLHKVPDSPFGLVYVDPDADLSGYDRFLLVDVQVAFKKDWQKEINRVKPYSVTPAEMQKMKAGLSGIFMEIFSDELQTSGFVLTDEQAEDVLIIRPAILDLNVNSPDTGAGLTRNLTESVGDMTLYLELRDSLTGDILAKALDFQVDRSRVTTFMRDRTRNEIAARQILTEWAQILVNGLNEAKTVHSGSRVAD
jgi:hypothetical protein